MDVRPLNIGLIAGEYPPMQGGLGDFTRELARALAMQGHHPHVLAPITPSAPTHEEREGVEVHRLVRRWGWHTRHDIAAFVQAHEIDVLNLQYQAAAYQMHGAINLLPMMWSRTWPRSQTSQRSLTSGGPTPHIPLLTTFHDLRVPYLFPKAGPLRWQAVLQMARASTTAIVTNAEDEQTLHQAGLHNVAQIPIGSNIAPNPLDHVDGAAWRAKYNISSTSDLIGYFGFMNESKGGETLVRALALLRGRGLDVAVLQIGGQVGASDPTNVAYQQRLNQLAQQLGVNDAIYATGFLEDRGVSEAFAACQCLALPYRDGVSFRRGTLMAALVHGCAIVTTTPRVDLPEVRDVENMMLIAPDSPEQLADAIQRVLQDGALRQRLQQGALKLAQRFGWAQIAAETVEVFCAAIRQWSTR